MHNLALLRCDQVTSLFVYCSGAKVDKHIDWHKTDTHILYATDVAYDEFRIVMAGLIIDLMRIYTMGADDTKFWNGIVERIANTSK